jgi:transaldolase
MKGTRQLRDIGQSIWLDNITRGILDDGTLARYVDELSVTGLTSNPTIFDAAIADTSAYDAEVLENARAGMTPEESFVALALADLGRAADLFRRVFDATSGVDGWVSMELSPHLAYDTRGSIEAAARIHRQAQRANLFVKIPGTPEGIPAIAESIHRGVPINVTLLFSCEQYSLAADAYLRGIERRLAEGLDPAVPSVASLFVSRWDKATADRVGDELRNRLGIAIAARTYRAYRQMLASSRWRRLAAAGARPQRLLWASTGTKDPAASDVLYVHALAAPDTINTMPPATLLAFEDHGRVERTLPEDGGDADDVLARFEDVGIDLAALATELQHDGERAFTQSWETLMRRIDAKTSGSAASRQSRA